MDGLSNSEISSQLVTTESGEQVDNSKVRRQKSVYYAVPLLANFAKEEINNRNTILSFLGEDDPQTTRLAQNQIVSRGTTPTSFPWQPLVEDFEYLIHCEPAKLKDYLTSHKGFLSEDVIIGNTDNPHTLSRFRLEEIKDTDQGSSAVVQSNLERRTLSSLYVTPPESVSEGTSTVIPQSATAPIEYLRRYNPSDRVYLDPKTGKSIDLTKIQLGQGTDIWVVAKDPNKSVKVQSQS